MNNVIATKGVQVLEETSTQERKCKPQQYMYMEMKEHCYFYINPDYEDAIYDRILLQNYFNTWIWKYTAQIQ